MPLSPDPSTKIKRLIIIVVTGLTLALDQASKFLILKYLSTYETIKIIPGFFNITRIHNPGGAFGFLAGQAHEVRVAMFILVSLMAAGFILYLYIKTPQRHSFLLTGLALIFGGALGNLADRIRSGTVVDFLDFHINSLHWPAFNVADSAISVGMAVLMFHILFKKVPV